MNSEQHAKARAVIEGARILCGSALLDRSTFDPRGYVCCALGELIIAAGHTPEEIRTVNMGESREYVRAFPLLVREFGLSEDGCDEIVSANDDPPDVDYDAGVDWPAERKAAVLATLDRLSALPTKAGG